MNEDLRRRLRVELLEIGFLNMQCIDLVEKLWSEAELTPGQRNYLEQLKQILLEGVGGLTALSDRVAAGEIFTLS
ncbi:TPA: hypothetical protein VDU70_005119 [Pseudomonas aeruginosa]|nr:hypothetical protein [Pseudomonas aeruginosa]HEP8853864.1 hypothetical protein [Pseudomonas aeruginosa]